MHILVDILYNMTYKFDIIKNIDDKRGTFKLGVRITTMVCWELRL